MQRLKIALPDELRARLDAASAQSGQSVAEEIRSRVEASFAREVADTMTRDFLEGVGRMAAEIALECGAAWHKHAGAYATFTRTILSRLEALKPEGSTVFGDRPHATTFADDPDELGQRIEFRLRQQPDFTTSKTRELLEAEHKRARLSQLGAIEHRRRGTAPVSLLNEPPNQPKKRGK